MGNATFVGRIGSLAEARGAPNVRRIATRMTVSISLAAAVVLATVAPLPVSTLAPPVRLSAGSTALIMGGTGIPKPDAYYIDTVKNQYIVPTHPDVEAFVPVKIPDEGWPLTGFVRVSGLVFGSPSVWGPASSAWPDEPWWKLSGLFDLTFNQSVQAGVADLETEMALHGNNHLVIYGYSQGAMVAIQEKRKLAEQYSDGPAPDIDFVLSGDPSIPNGGILARFPGLYVPIIDLTFAGPEPTDTQFDTIVITRQYDGLSDFPLYPLNFIADLNAVLGLFYVHLNDLDVSLADKSSAPIVSEDPTVDTTYYFFETQDLPLFGPLRSLGVPEALIDVVEPFFREVVELGYDRSIPPWEPTPARLIPSLDPAKVTTDLVNAIGQGFKNAAALAGSPAPLSIPTGSGATDKNAAEAPVEVTQDRPEADQPPVGQVLAAVRGHIKDSIDELKSVTGDLRTVARPAGVDNDSAADNPTRSTPLRDAVAKARADFKKDATQVSDHVRKAQGSAGSSAGRTLAHSRALNGTANSNSARVGSSAEKSG